ncbi:IclR family transcriptional regulator [Phytoactinopolyspora halotolerans]|uniref:IclR family transcriptional regulator n=1 Tax=Phytoactinopolyspora halotolerans TaxID=1981512 RepID=A0A6L9SDH5_9ACTN|nr:IclR family transcriptional regulator [Phytoactinopolyspora halotolerans]NEE02080.1 IclR family transcriptional regulator [Phytoactinopolyspora halotolerans]
MAQGRTVPAVDRAVKILNVFLDGQGPRTVPEITAHVDLPRSTTYELVQTLVANNYLRAVDGYGNRFDLGIRLLELGSTFSAGIDLAEQGRVVADTIMARCNETVHIATRDGRDVIYLVKADSPHAVRMVSGVGRRLPAHCTAVGKAMLADLSDDELAELYRDVTDWPAMTPKTITTFDELLDQLHTVRGRGLAYDDCESNPDVKCVAAAVRDLSGAVVAGISISVPVHRADHRLDDELTHHVAEGARDLSARLGYTPRPGQA